jgi:hypothetical protein
MGALKSDKIGSPDELSCTGFAKFFVFFLHMFRTLYRVIKHLEAQKHLEGLLQSSRSIVFNVNLIVLSKYTEISITVFIPRSVCC